VCGEQLAAPVHYMLLQTPTSKTRRVCYKLFLQKRNARYVTVYPII